MALKDWKEGKWKNNYGELHKSWTNRNRESWTIVVGQGELGHTHQHYINGWQVWDNRYYCTAQSFKTKSQALKFAKSYMRTH